MEGPKPSQGLFGGNQPPPSGQGGGRAIPIWLEWEWWPNHFHLAIGVAEPSLGRLDRGTPLAKWGGFGDPQLFKKKIVFFRDILGRFVLKIPRVDFRQRKQT